jgi:hypothetical protein
LLATPVQGLALGAVNALCIETLGSTAYWLGKRPGPGARSWSEWCSPEGPRDYDCVTFHVGHLCSGLAGRGHDDNPRQPDAGRSPPG